MSKLGRGGCHERTLACDLFELALRDDYFDLSVFLACKLHFTDKLLVCLSCKEYFGPVIGATLLRLAVPIFAYFDRGRSGREATSK